MKKQFPDTAARFGMTPEGLQALVGEALAGGGDWCDLFFEDTCSATFILHDNKVTNSNINIDYGCGIRVLSGEKTGYAYAESTEPSALKEAARYAGAIAAGKASAAAPLKFDAFRPPVSRKAIIRSKEDWRSAEASSMVRALRELDGLIHAADSRVHKVIATLSWTVSDILMYNSLGECTADNRPCGSVNVTTIFEQGGKTETTTASRSFRCGAEMITPALLQDLARQCTEGIDERFEARRPKGGKMPVVMAAGASGILLHEAMGHAFEADFIRKGQSIFSDRAGKRVARKGVNIVDDGTIPGNRGACLYDDEGVPGQRTVMVEDGILRSFLHDRISAAHFGTAPTGNGRRESFRYNPIPRMRCTYMESGPDGTVDDLIASVKKGIFVDQFANGQVKIGEGDFTFYVKSGRLIENGRLTMPIKDINIVGNGPRALADIVAVAGDLKIDDSTWTCGKEQSVPVSCGTPSVLIDKLTVGGE